MTVNEYNELLEELMKKYNKKKPVIPARVLEESMESIVKIYGEVYARLFKELLEELIDNFGVLASPSYQSQLALLQLIEKRLEELDSTVALHLKVELEKAYISASVFSVLAEETVKTIEDLMGAVPYSTLNTYKMEQIVADTMEDLLFTTKHTEKELKKFIRETFTKNLQYHALIGENQDNIKKLVEKELSKKFLKEALEKKGFVGIVDSSGRKWNTKTYVNMVVKTKLNQAYVEGLKDRAKDTGKDLAVIPIKGATDSCKYFEGMIISLLGATEGFPTYEDLKATGLIFHPNCVHSPFPAGKLDLIPDEDIEYHNKKIRELKNVTNSRKKNKKS